MSLFPYKINKCIKKKEKKNDTYLGPTMDLKYIT